MNSSNYLALEGTQKDQGVIQSLETSWASYRAQRAEGHPSYQPGAALQGCEFVVSWFKCNIKNNSSSRWSISLEDDNVRYQPPLTEDFNFSPSLMNYCSKRVTETCSSFLTPSSIPQPHFYFHTYWTTSKIWISNFSQQREFQATVW